MAQARPLRRSALLTASRGRRTRRIQAQAANGAFYSGARGDGGVLHGRSISLDRGDSWDSHGPERSVVPHASVSLRSNNTDQTRTTVTDDNGEYRLSFLQPGLYDLTVSATGIVPIVVQQVVVQITEVTRGL
jgi:hypothetical protein